MIIHTTFIIIICFKEIYSWNSAFANSFAFASFISQSYQYSDDKVSLLKKRSLNSASESLNATIGGENIDISLNNKSMASHSVSRESLNHNIDQNFTSPNETYPTSTDNPISSSEPLQNNHSNSPDFLQTQSSTIEEHGGINVNISLGIGVTISPQNESSSTDVSVELPTTPTVSKVTTTENVTYSTINPKSTADDKVEAQLHPIHYFLIILSVIAVLCLIAYGVYHFYRKEQVRRLRLQLMPVYNFDPTESDDWENNLLEEEFSLRSKEKDKSTGVTSGATITVSEDGSRGHVPVTHL